MPVPWLQSGKPTHAAGGGGANAAMQAALAGAVDGGDNAGVATMEAVARGDKSGAKRVGRWTLAQLRQTDGIIPSQLGTNKYDSQKGMIGMGTIRNTMYKIKSEALQEIPIDILKRGEAEVRAQSGTNRYASQRGFVSFGTSRDVARESHTLGSNLQPVPEEKALLSEGVVRLQSGSNRFASQKGMTGMGTARRELTRMIDSKHPEYDHEHPDQAHLPLQTGTNRFASQKGMTAIGMARRELTHMVDTKHPEYVMDINLDASTIPSQMGSNKYASQVGMTSMGQRRWEVGAGAINRQTRKSQGIVPSQYGSNQFASQLGMTSFGAPRLQTTAIEGEDLPYEEIKKSACIIPSQAGWNRGDSQAGYTSFGMGRDVKGKHLKRIWELEFPEEAEAPEMNRL